MTRPDWVKVQLSKKGLEIAGGGVLRVVTGHFEFELEPGQTLEVTKAEWNVALKHQVRDGEPLAEIVIDPRVDDHKNDEEER